MTEAAEFAEYSTELAAWEAERERQAVEFTITEHDLQQPEVRSARDQGPNAMHAE